MSLPCSAACIPTAKHLGHLWAVVAVCCKRAGVTGQICCIVLQCNAAWRHAAWYSQAHLGWLVHQLPQSLPIMRKLVQAGLTVQYIATALSVITQYLQTRHGLLLACFTLVLYHRMGGACKDWPEVVHTSPAALRC